MQLHLEGITGRDESPDRTAGTWQGLGGIHPDVEAARAVRRCDYSPLHNEGENAPHLPRSSVRNPSAFRPCHPSGLTSPHPWGTAIPVSHPSLSHRGCFCFSASQAWEGQPGQTHPGFAFPVNLGGHKRRFPRGRCRSQRSCATHPFCTAAEGGPTWRQPRRCCCRDPAGCSPGCR